MIWFLWPRGITNPNKKCQAPSKPMFDLCFVPIGNHLILAKRRITQLHREVFSSSYEAKKCQCFCLTYISLAGDHLGDPCPEAWCCRSRDKSLCCWDILGRQRQRKVVFKLELLYSQYRIKKSRLSQMLMRWHRLWAGFVLFSSQIKQRHVRTRELEG